MSWHVEEDDNTHFQVKVIEIYQTTWTNLLSNIWRCVKWSPAPILTRKSVQDGRTPALWYCCCFECEHCRISSGCIFYMGCVSSAPECGTLRRTLPLKPAARHGCYSLFLDPYDGSSEDSDEANVDVGVSRRAKRQGQGGGGGCRFSGRSRRFILHHPASVARREVIKNGIRDPVTEQQHLLDVQMKCGSDSELWVCELDTLPTHSDKDGGGDVTVEMVKDSTTHTPTLDMESHLNDSGLSATRSSTPHTAGPLTPVGGSPSWMLDSSSERSPSPSNLRSLYKRKLGLPGAEVVEVGQRKRQCVVNVEDEQEAGDSASEPC